MKVLFINGSPKGDLSVTMHYALYIAKRLPGHEYSTLDVGKEIKSIEKSPAKLASMIEQVRASDVILWCYPVYTLSVPGQLKRFIELMFEGDGKDAFKGKYAATLTTSAHFYDNLAHDYTHAISEDLCMRYAGGFSAAFADLFKDSERESLIRFAKDLFACAERCSPVATRFAPVANNTIVYDPAPMQDKPKSGSVKAALVTDATPEDTNLNKMIDAFVRSAEYTVDVINLNDIKMSGGCLGCIRCGYDGTCVYKDDVRDVYINRLMPADIIVYASRVKDRHMTSLMKTFTDRGFFNGHRPTSAGKQAGFIISGPLRQLPYLRQDLEARADVGHLNLAGIVTDEDESGHVTALLSKLAADLGQGVREGTMKPRTFLGVGGHKVFRDLIYGFRGIFRQDDRFYQKRGMYDFPQKDWKGRVQSRFLIIIMTIPPIRKKFYSMAKEGMVRQYSQLLK